MNNHEVNFEENLRRLLKASCGPQAAVDPVARERLRAELTLLLNRRLEVAEFPESVLAFLTALVLLTCVAWAACAWCSADGLPAYVLNGPILALVIVNLIGIPVAGLVIVLRRKHAWMDA